MESQVPVSLLKPHPKNKEYFSEPSPEKREEIKRSVAAHGIRDPLKVAPDFTVIAGHLRLEIAKELGLEKVPVEIVDGDPLYLEYLLVADNEERRTCEDPIKKAKRAEFLKRYWGLREGSANPKGTSVCREAQSEPDDRKTLADVAEAIGEDLATTKRLLKLNDLIPPLQELVSRGKLGRIAAYSLAFLPEEEQERLLEVLGESGVCGLSAAQAREIRKALEEERERAEAAEKRLAALERELAAARAGSAEAERLRAELEALRRENEELKARRPEIVERVVEKTVEIPVEKEIIRPDPATLAQLEAARKEIARLSGEVEMLQNRLAVLAADGERARAKAANLERERDELRQRIETMKRQIDKLAKGAPIPEVPLKREIDKAATLAAEMAVILDGVVRRPDKIKELAQMARRAPSTASADPVEEAAAACAELAAAVTVQQAGLTFSMAAKAITEFLEALRSAKEDSPRLRVVKKSGDLLPLQQQPA